MTREEQKEKRREEILRAGLGLFIKKGYSGTKIGDIAKKAGMSIGLMFHYFENKEKLYEELLDLGVFGPQSMLMFMDLEPLEFFTTCGKSIFEYMEQDILVAQMFILVVQAQNNEDLSDHLKEKLEGADILQTTTSKIIEGQEKGEIREGDPLALSVAYWSSLTGIAEQLVWNPELPYPDSDWLVDILRKQ